MRFFLTEKKLFETGRRRLFAVAEKFASDRRGGITLIFALSATLLVALVGGSIDYARLVTRRAQLQDAVDTGVLTGGNALKLAGSDPKTVNALTESTIRDAAHPIDSNLLSIQTAISAQKDGVSAVAKEIFRLSLGGIIGLRTSTITVSSRATIVGKMRLCLLATDPGAAGSVNLQSSSRVTAESCSIYTNSNNQMALLGAESAMARAETICSAGGYFGARANFTPSPQVGCPVIKDPLQNRLGPPVGPCKTIPPSSSATSYLNGLGYHLDAHHQQLLTSLGGLPFLPGSNGSSSSTLDVPNKIAQSTILEPGTYCGGLLITGNAVVTLRPGNYIIKDGPLLVDKQAALIGDNVSIYFTGETAGLLFNTDTTISLTAPTSGQMAGILLSDDGRVSKPVDPTLYLNSWTSSLTDLHNCPLSNPPVSLTPPALGQSAPMRIYRIISNNTRQMLGTIHLPAGRLVLDGDRPVADQSNYTVIVAQQVNLYKGPNLILNANYDRSSVPVPSGVGPIGGQVRLTQ